MNKNKFNSLYHRVPVDIMDTIVSYYNAFAEYEANFKGQVRIGCVAWLSHRDARDLNNARQISSSSHPILFSVGQKKTISSLLVLLLSPFSSSSFPNGCIAVPCSSPLCCTAFEYHASCYCTTWWRNLLLAQSPHIVCVLADVIDTFWHVSPYQENPPK